MVSKCYENDITGEVVSFNQIISKHIKLISDTFPFKVRDLILNRYNLDYTPDKNVVSKEVIITDALVSDLRFVFQLVSREYQYELDDFVQIDEVDLAVQKRDLEHFIVQFKVNEDKSIAVGSNILNKLSNVRSLFAIGSRFEIEHIEDAFWKANECLLSLRDKRLVPVSNENVDGLKNYHETDSYSSWEVEVNNNDIFGACDHFAGEPKELMHLNLRVNDLQDFPPEVLTSFMNSRMINIATKSMFEKHLKRIDLIESENTYEELEDILNDHVVDKYNMFVPLNTEREQYEPVLNSLEREKRNINGRSNVFINSNNFKFSILPTLIERLVLSDDEVNKLLAVEYRVGSGLYKIRNVYVSHDKAFELIKNNFRKDRFIFRYVFEEKEEPGFYIDFKKS